MRSVMQKSSELGIRNRGIPFFYRLYTGRYAIARAGLGSSLLWKIETKDSTFVQVGERGEGELYGSHLENSSRSARRKGKRNARGGWIEEGKSKSLSLFYRKIVRVYSCYRGSLLLVYR